MRQEIRGWDMLTQQEQIFFHLLRSVLWGTPAEVPADVDWQGLLNLASRQKCLHAFSVWLKTHHISTPFDKQLQTSMFMMLQRVARLNHLSADVMAVLEKNNIPATLIKGYSLSGLYPDPDMREFGDVDIYVGETNYMRAAEVVTAAYPDAHWHSGLHGGLHYILVLDENMDRVVELHRVTMEFSDAKADTLYQAFTHRYLDHNTQSVSLYETTIPVPPMAYNTLYVFMHAWHHFECDGIGFRQLGDWALSLQHTHQQLSPTEWQSLVTEIDQILTAIHLKTIWQTFGHVLVNQLHLPADAFPLYTSRYQRRAKRLLRQLLRDGHRGRPSDFRIKEIALMRRFAGERPKKYRVLQVVFTLYKLLFNAWQVSKYSPTLAWHELQATLLRSGTKKRT